MTTGHYGHVTVEGDSCQIDNLYQRRIFATGFFLSSRNLLSQFLISTAISTSRPTSAHTEVTPCHSPHIRGGRNQMMYGQGRFSGKTALQAPQNLSCRI